MRRRGLLLLAALGVIAANVIVVAAFLPPPSAPPNASRAERLYFLRCATCHGPRGEGSWRSTLFLVRPGNLADPDRMAGLPDQYLFDIIRHGGAPLGKPGMPSFSSHFSDGEIRELLIYVRTLSRGNTPPE
ncbi:MAG: c-type cytochrome [Candidatus Methylomirabilia bacterium]